MQIGAGREKGAKKIIKVDHKPGRRFLPSTGKGGGAGQRSKARRHDANMIRRGPAAATDERTNNTRREVVVQRSSDEKGSQGGGKKRFIEARLPGYCRDLTYPHKPEAPKGGGKY